jgi:hypothetical protein
MSEDKGQEGKKETYGTGSLKGGEYDAEDIFAGAEPWSPIETKLIIWSFVAAAVALIIGGVLVNIFLL